MATSGKLAGIDYKVTSELTKTGTRKRRRPTLDELRAVREACERSQRSSDELRQTAGLEPVPTNFYREHLAAAIAEREAKPTRKAPSGRKAQDEALAAERDALQAKVDELKDRVQHLDEMRENSVDVFHMSGAELRELDSSEARAEIDRREAKRAAIPA